jgi:DNA-binding transcriptional ArsR family regulator
LTTLVATYGDGDEDNVLLAMRRLPYSSLVLVGTTEEREPAGLEELRRLEAVAGHELVFERLSSQDFMGMVDDISEIMSGLQKSDRHDCELIISIGGGPKLVADAALFAAFRMGVPAFHVSDRLVRLPVMKGVTARNRFTHLQSQFIETLDRPRTLAGMEQSLQTQSRQSVERVMRDLKKMGIVSARLDSGGIILSLTDEGEEVRRVLAASNGPGKR